MNAKFQAQTVFIGILLLSLLCSAELEASQIRIDVTTDKPSYNPGDRMKIFVNITNLGGEEVLAKELHAIVVAKSWFGIIVHEESKSFSRNFNANKTRFGYVEVPIPSYTPLGKYEIEIWATYGSPEGLRQIVEEEDSDSNPGKAEIEVNLGLVFLLLILGFLGLLVYILSTIYGGKKPARAPIRRMRKDATKMTDVTIEYAIIIALIVCIAISLVYVGYSKKEKETFSVLYVKPGSYSNIVKDGSFTFTYGVECHEKYPTDYELMMYLGGILIDKEAFELCNLGSRSIQKIEEKKTLHIPSDTQYPIQLKLKLKSWDRDYENLIWLRSEGDEA